MAIPPEGECGTCRSERHAVRLQAISRPRRDRKVTEPFDRVAVDRHHVGNPSRLGGRLDAGIARGEERQIGLGAGLAFLVAEPAIGIAIPFHVGGDERTSRLRALCVSELPQ